LNIIEEIFMAGFTQLKSFIYVFHKGTLMFLNSVVSHIYILGLYLVLILFGNLMILLNFSC